MSLWSSQVLISATTSSSAAWMAWRAEVSAQPSGSASRADQVVPMVAPASAAACGAGREGRAA